MRRGIALGQIESFEYLEEKKILDVRFMRVGHYEFLGVPKNIGDAMMLRTPEEAVHIFDSAVEGKYKSVRIGG